MHRLLLCAHHSRMFSGQKMALKIASLDSNKHHSLEHQKSCLLALRSLWGQCIPHVLLAGELKCHGHGYGLGTTLLMGRHPAPGNALCFAIQTIPGPCTYYVTGRWINRLLKKAEVLEYTCCAAGDTALLPLAEEALRKVHACNILVNDLHPNNIVLTGQRNRMGVLFVDFSHSDSAPTLAQLEKEICSLRAVFS